MLALRAFFLCFIYSAFVTGAAAQGWPVTEKTTDTLPNIEVSLAPPAQPFPQAQAAIGSLDIAREAFQADQMRQLKAHANVALHDAKTRVSQTVARALRIFDGAHFVRPVGLQQRSATRGRAVSFIGVDDNDFSFNVNVGSPKEPTDQSIRDSVDAIERKRVDLEQDMFHQASSEMATLTDTVLAELEVQLQSHANAMLIGRAPEREKGATASSVFLEAVGQPEQANVRIVPSHTAFPTIGSLVQDMEARRDISERLEHATIIDLELTLLEAANAYIKQALEAGVQRVLAERSVF